MQQHSHSRKVRGVQPRNDRPIPPELAALRGQFDACLLAERQSLWRHWRQLIERAQRGDDIAIDSEKFVADLQQSIAKVSARRAQMPVIQFAEALPISARREEIAAAISAHQVVIIAGETGSGKTTQLPKICLELGRGSRGLIGHTQPRRLAARSVATRIAEELQSPLGALVGYQVRFTDQVSEASRIKLMTDGILLAEIQQDRFLNRYDTLIIDEAHERSLNIDFLLGYLKQLLRKRPDLKLIITSATIDLERFSRHFDNAPIIEVSGRTFPVEVLYRPIEALVSENDLSLAIEAALVELSVAEKGLQGDVLVFLPGEREIREAALQLRRSAQNIAALAHLDILPLYARLSASEQQRVFDLSKRRGIRVVLATNVAETSITVPGIRYVIDPGLARISRYSYRSKLQRLPIEPISQASAEQRTGRCGRVAAGICVRLYDEQDFARRPQFTDAEILRTNLASVILQLLSMRLGDIENFPFIDAPDKRQIGDGFSLLEELGAVDASRELTAVGRTLAKLPVDPRMARMVTAAAQRGSLREVLIIASALGVQDPRERPADKQQQADECHRRFHNPESDFLGFVALWDYFEEQRQALSQNQLRKQCEREFLSYLRLREWRDIHHQLRLVCQELGFKENQQPADYESVHRALLAGLLSHVATQDEQREFLAARNRKLRLFPGSALYKKPPKWIVAAEIVETAQVYARSNARIDPLWVLGINDALLKRRHSEPHWNARSGQVTALETVTLYGLVISDKQRVHYGPIEPVRAREIFIRNALVAGDYRTSAPYFRHNRELITDIEELEEKARRRDILADEEELFRFYDERLPADIITARRFEQWRQDAEKQQPKLLFAPRERLMRHAAAAITEAQFPDSLLCGDLLFALTYHFEPGSADDGVNVRVPIGVLNRVPEHRFEWLVPALLRDKCISLLKALPKQYRRLMVPVPDTVDKIMPMLKAGDSPLLEALSAALQQIGIRVPADAWQVQDLEAFYCANFQVFDADAKLLGQGRDLVLLKQQLHAPMTASLQAETQHEFKRTAIAQWDFGELPQAHQFKQAGVTITAYPALVDQGDSVALQLLESPERAESESEQGLIRLLQLQTQSTVKWLRKELLRGNLINLQLAGIDQRREDWVEEILTAIYRQLFVADQPLPRTEADFNQRLQARQSEIVPLAQRYATLLHAIAENYAQIRAQRRKGSELAWLPVLDDIDRQLAGLFRPGFIASTPWQWLQQYPRYLQAITLRLEKLRGHFQRDRDLSRELTPLQNQLTEWLRRNPEGLACTALQRYRWLLEEYRVSLFAQALGTREPVSAKRLRELWELVRKECA